MVSSETPAIDAALATLMTVPETRGTGLFGREQLSMAVFMVFSGIADTWRPCGVRVVTSDPLRDIIDSFSSLVPDGMQERAPEGVVASVRKGTEFMQQMGLGG